MYNPTQNWGLFFLNVLQVNDNVQQNVQKNLNCPVKGSLKEIEYFTCPSLKVHEEPTPQYMRLTVFRQLHQKLRSNPPYWG